MDLLIILCRYEDSKFEELLWQKAAVTYGSIDEVIS